MRPREWMRVVPGERRDRAGLVGRDLVDDAVERERLVAEQERAAGDRRDQRDLVAVGEHAVALGILLVDRVEEADGLVAEVERGPDVGDRRSVDLALATSPRARAGRRRGGRARSRPDRQEVAASRSGRRTGRGSP